MVTIQQVIIALQRIVCFQLLQQHVPDMFSGMFLSFVVYINSTKYKSSTSYIVTKNTVVCVFVAGSLSSLLATSVRNKF